MAIFDELAASITARLDEGDRGDRGWWLITRVHLTSAKIQQIVIYLNDAGADSGIELSDQHYAEIGQIVGVEKNVRQSINRHYFLAMDEPLRLIERTNGRFWTHIRLTPRGQTLATTDDPLGLFEASLADIRFCKQPWYSAGREAHYPEFDILPYAAILEVMSANDGYVDMDEFDLFISRIRTESEIASAAANVNKFRSLKVAERSALLQLVDDRIPASGTGNDERKAYHNWRDVARHTFSLFSLGLSAERHENELHLSSKLSSLVTKSPNATVPTATAVGVTTQPTHEPAIPVPTANKATKHLAAMLLIPDVSAPAELLVPPSAPQTNSGLEAELLIGKLFAAAGWTVVYYNRKRGYGFDLWVRKDEHAFIIEVKSFVGKGATVSLTHLEQTAAIKHAENFLLIVVEQATGPAPEIHVVRNPASCLSANPVEVSQFTVARSVWRSKAEALQL